MNRGEGKARGDMDDLNPQQRRAVQHDGGPLLILAGAGTGKTRVITARLASLLDRGVKPENLLGVTFTNKAAEEMRSRLAGLAGRRRDLRQLILSTFHSLALRLIRRDARRLGLTPGFSICDRAEQLSVVRKAASTVKGVAELPPETLLSRIGSLKNRGVAAEAFARSALEEDEQALAAVYRRYQEAMRRRDSLDFDDLVLQAGKLLRDCPEALEYWRDRFHYIMIDEFQDANPSQFDMMRRLAAPRDNLCVVGDDDQSIYAWRGAAAGNILKFHETYPGAAVITLEQNYRSTEAILSAANAVIRRNGGRREKNLWSALGRGRLLRLREADNPGEEAEGVAADIRERLAEPGSRPSDFAVIVRANAQSRPFEDEFIAARLPFEIIGGQSLFDRKEARDVLAFLSLIANPEAGGQLLRVINVPPRGIGGGTVDALSARAAREGVSLVRLLDDPELEKELGGPRAGACRRFAAQIAAWRERLEKKGPDGLVRQILDEVDYQEELRQLYRDPLEIASRWNQALEMDEALATFAEHNPSGSPAKMLSAFLDEAILSDRPERKRDRGEVNAIRIITVHSAKGLEFPRVFIPGLEEEIFPHKNAIEDGMEEEERRLFYVAMTRAGRELTLSWNRTRRSRGKERKCRPSRFLADIPGECCEAGTAPPGAGGGEAEGDFRAILASIRDKFRL